MLKNLLLITSCFLFCLSLSGQSGLQLHYNFDTIPPVDQTGNNVPPSLVGFNNISLACAPNEQGLVFDGNSVVLVNGVIGNYFANTDLTISFYFKLQNFQFSQTILSKRSDCNGQRDFSIDFVPNNGRQLVTTFVENSTRDGSMTVDLDPTSCWYHYVFIRRGSEAFIYINGKLEKSIDTGARVNIKDDIAVLSIANSPCVDPASGLYRFSGVMDDLKIYNKAIDEDEVQALYISPNEILNNDTIVYLGNDVQVRLGPTCSGFNYEWFPKSTLDDPFIGEPLITPDKTQTYQLRMNDNQCLAIDTFKIIVIDPDTLNCNVAFLPGAFTPNGDFLNDTWGLSNTFALDELLELSIFDKWGSQMFFTDDIFEQWDGTFNGTQLDPGAYVYKMRFVCNGEEKLERGTVLLIR